MKACDLFLSLTLPTMLLLCPAMASGQAEKEAKKHFKNGVVLYQEGGYEAALVEFRESFEIKANWKVRYYIGVTLHALHRFVEAEEALLAYLDKGGKNVPEDKRAEVEDILSGIEDVIGSLDLAADVEGASIFVNGKLAGETPLARPIRLDVGHYEVAVKKEGYEDWTGEIDVPGGKTVRLEVSLESKPTEETKEKKHGRPMKTAGWAVLGAGGALLAAGVVTGAMALSLGGDLEDKCTGGECAPKDHKDHKRMDDLALSTDILLGVGAAAAVAGAALLIVDWKSERKTISRPAVSFAAPAGFSLTWRY